jgi:DNA-binding transcriptional LysR family regulator
MKGFALARATFALLAERNFHSGQNLVVGVVFVKTITYIVTILYGNIRTVDLNLLRTFHAVHATRNVSRAADRLGLSQPTVSHALRRLRELYKDPLFVRTQGGMAPTAKADSLAKAVQHALHILDVAIDETEHYDPARSERTFRLYMTDIGETVFLPPLTRALAKIAPRIRLDIFQLDEKDIRPALETGRIDLAIGYLPVLADGGEAVSAAREIRGPDARRPSVGAHCRARLRSNG